MRATSCGRLRFSGGRWDMVDEIGALLDKAGPGADLDILTGACSTAHAKVVAEMRKSGRVGRLRVAVDASRVHLEPARAEPVQAAIGADRMRLARVHAKLAVVRGPNGVFGSLSSANLNHCARDEQFEDAGPALCEAITAMMDGIFDRGPRGIVGATARDARQAYVAALVAAKRAEGPGLIVHDNAEPPMLRGVEALDIVHSGRTGTTGLILRLASLAGRGARVVTPSWSIGTADVRAFHDARASGVVGELAIMLPARVGRRGSTAQAYADLLQHLSGCVDWRRTHTKASVITGPDACFVVTGTMNLNAAKDINVVRVTRDATLGAEVEALLMGSEPDETPAHPTVEPTVYADTAMRAKAGRVAPPEAATPAGWIERARALSRERCAQLALFGQG